MFAKFTPFLQCQSACCDSRSVRRRQADSSSSSSALVKQTAILTSDSQEDEEVVARWNPSALLADPAPPLPAPEGSRWSLVDSLPGEEEYVANADRSLPSLLTTRKQESAEKIQAARDVSACDKDPKSRVAVTEASSAEKPSAGGSSSQRKGMPCERIVSNGKRGADRAYSLADNKLTITHKEKAEVSIDFAAIHGIHVLEDGEGLFAPAVLSALAAEELELLVLVIYKGKQGDLCSLYVLVGSKMGRMVFLKRTKALLERAKKSSDSNDPVAAETEER